jgi:protein-S-isoprenylcysteine O-methyltransferase Ste14
MSRPVYEHRQFGWLMAAIGAVIAIALLVMHAQGPLPAAVWLVPLIVLVLAALLGSLRVTVDRKAVRWHFGPGIWRKHVALAQISDVEVTRTRFWNGWGIRLTPRGWLYNVAGLDAVMIRTRDGKAVLIGSDEPRRLKAAIDRVRPR